jgi:import inner membrane translocase subunit TIM16
MASRVLANLLVAGGSALVRAASRAYRQALVNAQRTGVANEASNGGATASKGMFGGARVMNLGEAREVLGVTETATYEEVHARFERLFESNEKNGGSFYLQSKIYRARERLDGEYDEEAVRATLEAAEARREARRAEAEAEAKAEVEAKAEGEATTRRVKEGEGEA